MEDITTIGSWPNLHKRWF